MFDACFGFAVTWEKCACVYTRKQIWPQGHAFSLDVFGFNVKRLYLGTAIEMKADLEFIYGYHWKDLS